MSGASPARSSRSATRVTEADDSSGQRIQTLLREAGHVIEAYSILKDEPDPIRQAIASLPLRSRL
jgi:molybdopterin biosynthesis enzyme MoaB